MDQAKVNLLEDESSRRKRKQFFILVSTTLFICIITSIISIFTVLKNHAENQSLAANSISAVQSACRATQHYYPCVESLKSQLNHNHRIHASDIIRLSISAAFLEFYIINTLPQELASKVANEYAKPELTDCQTLFTDSLSQLNRSVIMISNHVGPDKKIGSTDRDMIIYFIERAKNNVDRCLDGLERSNGTMAMTMTRWKIVRIKRLVKVRVDKAKIYMMNSLAILENKDVVDEIFDPSVGSILASFMLSREYFVLTIVLLCLQYLVLVFLFCFLLRVFMSRTRK